MPPDSICVLYIINYTTFIRFVNRCIAAYLHCTRPLSRLYIYCPIIGKVKHGYQHFGLNKNKALPKKCFVSVAIFLSKVKRNQDKVLDVINTNKINSKRAYIRLSAVTCNPSEWIKIKHFRRSALFFGAANQIRTGDLILTKDVLCHLSHSSKWRPGTVSNRRPLA